MKLQTEGISKLAADFGAEERPNLESEGEDFKYRLYEEHNRERHVEVRQSVTVDLVSLVFSSRVKLDTKFRHNYPID